MLLLERFEEIAVGAETVLTSDGILENSLAEGHKSKSHIRAEKDEGADGAEIRSDVGQGRKIQNCEEGKFGQDDSHEESKNVYRKNGLFGETGVRIKNNRNEKSENKETSELSGEVVRIFAIDEAVYKTPEQGGSDGNFDMFPSGLVNSGKKAEDFIFMR